MAWTDERRAALASLLESVRDGRLDVPDAVAALRDLPYQDLGYARLDHHRPLRTGWPEVVLAEGKTAAQTAGIVAAMTGRGHPVLVTRAAPDVYSAVAAAAPTAQYHGLARCIVVPDAQAGEQRELGLLILTGGTADLPVAEEAAITAQLMGCQVSRINDVGVAGLHRLLDQRERLQAARVDYRRRGHGSGAGQRGVWAGVGAGHRRAHQRRLWGQFRRDGRVAGGAEFLRARRGGGEHRQRLRGGLPGGADCAADGPGGR